jgi:hypothetical protein
VDLQIDMKFRRFGLLSLLLSILHYAPHGLTIAPSLSPHQCALGITGNEFFFSSAMANSSG